jgi:hypothetical protein
MREHGKAALARGKAGQLVPQKRDNCRFLNQQAVAEHGDDFMGYSPEHLATLLEDHC